MSEGGGSLKVFAIGDLHLPGGQDKPMDVFGAAWRDHPRKIRAAWLEMVSDDDVVLVPGDISWAMTLAEAKEDLEFLGSLPGRIIMIRGNHDYWWSGIGKVRRALPPNVHAVQNDHVPLTPEWAVCGTRGWVVPGGSGWDEEKDAPIYAREQIRLRMSLESAVKAGAERLIVMLHFPPVNERHEPSAFTRLLEEFPVVHCVYGHLHGAAQRGALRGTHRGVLYHLAACDAIGFRPLFIDKI